MSQTLFSRPPSNKGGTVDPFEFSKWLDRIWLALSGATGIAWRIVDKAGSKLSDLETRNHADLNEVKAANDTSDDATADRHISDAQGKAWSAQADEIAVQELALTTHVADTTVHHLAAAASADVASPDAVDLTDNAVVVLANELKASLNDLKAVLRAAGMLTP